MQTSLLRGRLLTLAALFTLGLSGSARAVPLNLTSGTPDITAFFLDFAFDSTGGVCGAGSNYTLCYSADSAAISSYGLTPELDPDSFAPYSLIAAVDPLTGSLTAAGGTFAIGSYLTGTVSQFGYAIEGGAAVLEFLIAVTDGSLAPQFGPTIGVIGTIFDWGTVGFGADLTRIDGADAFTDNFAVPEPATLCLLGTGLFAASVIRRRRTERRLP